MTKEDIINQIKKELKIENAIPFAVELWDGYDEITQNGYFSEDGVYRHINGVLFETYDEIDEDVLENCYNGRTSLTTQFYNKRLSIVDTKMEMVNLIKQALKNMGTDVIPLNFNEFSVNYKEIFFDDESCVWKVIVEYWSNWQLFRGDVPLSELSYEIITKIFEKITK